MRILDRYILKKVILSYLFILFLFIGLHILIDLFSTLSSILENQPPFTIVIQYYLSYLPLIILRVSPMALLLSVLYNYSNLNKNNELISIRASGVSTTRTALPSIFFAIFLSCFVFFLQEKMLLESQSEMEKIKNQYIEKETEEAEIKNLAFISDRSIFFVELFLPQKEKMKNVIIFNQDKKGNLKEKTHIRLAKYQNGQWLGYDSISHNLIDPKKRAPVFSTEKNIPLSKNPRELAFEKSMFVEFAPLAQLRQQINNLQKFSTGSLLVNLRVEFYRKIAFPFAHVFLVIGSLPLALEIKKKKASFAAIGIGLIFSLLYSLMDSVSVALGKTEIILPFFSAWLAPLFFLSIGITGLILMR